MQKKEHVTHNPEHFYARQKFRERRKKISAQSRGVNLILREITLHSSTVGDFPEYKMGPECLA